LDRPAEQFRPGLQVKRMQALVVIAAGVLGHRYQVHGAVGSTLAVNYWGVGDSDLRSDLAAAVIITGGFAGGQGGHLPALRTRISIKGVGATVLGHDEERVLGVELTGQTVNIQRLRVHLTIHGEEVNLAKVIGVYIRRCQNGFQSILTLTSGAVMVGKDVAGITNEP